MDSLHEKRENLKAVLRSLGSAAVAFSGGVDSSFLLKVAHDVLGDRAVAVTAAPPFVPPRELEAAASFCRSENIRQIVLPAEALALSHARENPPDRCYHCKKEIFLNILRCAQEQSLAAVIEGTNRDDTGDYRPGMRALRELGIRSPLLELDLGKEEIRLLSRELGLPTWNKPSLACLASRFAYGEAITDEGLARVDRAEQLLFGLSFQQLRVRIHGDVARIEILPEEYDRLMDAETRSLVYERLKDYGFRYVTLDLRGYRSGSMNEVLT